ncbi:MAG: hypothetical protein R3C11_10760 [Planctomycetaceae bacterium]
MTDYPYSKHFPEFERWLDDAMDNGGILECCPDDPEYLIDHVVRFNEQIDSLIRQHGVDKISTAIAFIYFGSSHYSYYLAAAAYQGKHSPRFFTSINDLYTKGFAIHCVNSIDDNLKLNGVCYPFWFHFLEQGMIQPENRQVAEDAYRTLNFILTLKHLACQRSALKGLSQLWDDSLRCGFSDLALKCQKNIEQFYRNENVGSKAEWKRKHGAQK